MTSQLFKGLKILDLSTVLAGPSVATFFAELGAEVIKIENPLTHGDVTRSWKLPSEDQTANVSAYFSSINFGKKYIWKNLSDPNDQKEIRQYIQESDVVIVNFKFGDDIKFGLTPADVHSINPRIIYAAIQGFESNPERVAYDVVLQAETGYMSMNGTAESGPIKMPVALMDVIAAHQLKEAILCAYIQRERDGIGKTVSCSLEKAGISALVNQATNYLMAGQIATRIGSLHPNIAPYGEIFYCKDDKPLVLAVGSDKQFRQMLDILNAKDVQTSEQFSSNQQRVIHRKQMATLLAPHFKKNNREIWMQRFIEHGIPAGAIQNMDEVMTLARNQNMILIENLDGIETARVKSVAFKMV
jgi:crotonobetainyl-CoA:carnitine CoA-transferase CaiB-like acyl-CoA transferase